MKEIGVLKIDEGQMNDKRTTCEIREMESRRAKENVMEMGYELIIAEKPSVAQKIAYALSRDVRKRFGKRTVYYEVTKDSKQIIIVPAVGHLYSLKQKGQSTPAFDIEWVPSYELDKANWYMRGYLDTIHAMAKNASVFINATDYDIEGSLIGYNIIRFNGDLSRAKRMRFSTLTAGELNQAYENLEPIDTQNAIAGETRHMIDWFYGINLSRAIMNALRSAGRSRTLSIGRVQGPMLRVLAEREKEIKEFVSVPFWELFVHAKNIRFKHTTSRFDSESAALKAQNNTQPEGKIHIEKEKRTIYPFPAFDFTSLQVEAYRLFGFTPMQTQELAQSLYENTYLSYPRTASQKLPPQLNLPSIIQKISQIGRFSGLANKLINEKRFRPREGKKEDVHPALYPTGTIGKMSADEQKLYDLIAHRFLAAFAEPAEIEDNKIYLDAREKYVTGSTHIVNAGWIQFYPYSSIKETQISAFNEDERVRIDKFEILKGMTPPPQRFSPATILQLMEKEGIGTKTTRAIILETLYKRGYATGRQITVTPLGRAVYETFADYSPKIVNPELTRQLENEMEMIQEKKIDQQKVLSNAKHILTEILDDFSKNQDKIGKNLLEKLEESERFAPCKCGKGFLRIIERKGKYRFLGCSTYPECKTTYSLPPYGFVNSAGLCETCKAPKIWVAKGKQRYTYCLNRECPEKLEKLKRKEEADAAKKLKTAQEKKEKAAKKKEKAKEKAAKKEKQPKKLQEKKAKPELAASEGTDISPKEEKPKEKSEKKINPVKTKPPKPTKTPKSVKPAEIKPTEKK